MCVLFLKRAQLNRYQVLLLVAKLLHVFRANARHTQCLHLHTEQAYNPVTLPFCLTFAHCLVQL